MTRFSHQSCTFRRKSYGESIEEETINEEVRFLHRFSGTYKSLSKYIERLSMSKKEKKNNLYISLSGVLTEIINFV